MPNEPIVAVSSLGVVSSLGLTAPTTFAALRGGVDAYNQTYFLDHAHQRISGAVIPRDVLGLPNEVDGAVQGGDEKLTEMVRSAVVECAAGVSLGKTALLIVGPEEDRTVFSRGIEGCFAVCEKALGLQFHEGSRSFCSGSPGLADALVTARDLLHSRQVKSVLLVGVDSLLSTGDMHEGLLDGRILSWGTSDGYIPGEAAACVLLTRPADRPENAPPCVFVSGIGAATESRTLHDRKRSTGVGLAAAMKQALSQAGVGAHDVYLRYADVTAEPYFFEEASYAWSRVIRAPSPSGYKMITPVTRLGYVGAAMGPLLLALIVDEVRRGYRPHPIALIHLSNAGAARAAVLTIASNQG
ncbi:MAG: hypothetical protein IPK82_24800 [Polyangiaceae bacterium]|nr:hypothetical protein [Polyangiaceae bacterium]